MKVASIGELREIEAAADRSVMSYQQMMLRAGAVASASLQRRCKISSATRITLLIGKGNNGGDGLVMARELAQSTQAQIGLYLLYPREPSDANFRALLDTQAVVTLAADDRDGAELRRLLMSADIMVDALLGIGARLPLRGEVARALERANEVLGDAESLPQRPFVMAIDCPSGIDCDSGRADAHVIAADATISFIAGKPSLFTFPAANFVGDLEIATLGIPHNLPELTRLKSTVVDKRLGASLLPARPLDGHKGTFGKVMIVAGSPNYIGAVALAGESAYRSGAGLATIATTRRLTEVVAPNLREATWLPLPDTEGAIAAQAAEAVVAHCQDYDALLVGCGLGRHPGTAVFLRRLLASASLPALVLDADGMNLVSSDAQWWTSLPDGTVITPHPGELARLTGLSAKDINADRWAVARHYAQAWRLTLVLKGAHTLVAAPDGRVSVIPFKTDTLATAGTGDVLAGLIAGLRAQGLNAYDSARLGAYVHASAGIIAAENAGGSRSLIAGDLLTSLGRAFAYLENS